MRSEIDPQPEADKAREEVKTDSQKQEETESQPFLELKSPVKSSQIGNKSTGEEFLQILEESQR